MLNVETMRLELKQGGRYIELGGGAHPVLRPNVDVRPCHAPDGTPTVDFTADFEKPFTDEHGQAISTGEFDGVFSKYAIEHISWRKVPQFLGECRRILKPGGTLCLVMPNTQAQMEHLLRTQDWDDGGSMLFGGQDYGENSHKAFFTPQSTHKLLAEAGFVDVRITPHGAKGTDMIVQADAPELATPHGAEVGHADAPLGGLTLAPQAPPSLVKAPPEMSPHRYAREAGPGDTVKPAPEVVLVAVMGALRREAKARFGRDYFDRIAYWDYPCHYLTAQHVLARRPRSALELGCARGYVLKQLQDAGVVACGWDVSEHCWQTRVCEGMSVMDATDPESWGRLKDETFDLCYSVGFFDCVPEPLLPHVFEGMARKARRGLHGINFSPARGDASRVTCRDRKWWQERMPSGHEVVDKDELEAGNYPASLIEGDGKLKVNLGSFTTMFHHGWLNVDAANVTQFAQAGRFKFLHHDVREGLPWGTESVDMIYSSHMLEHLTYDEGFAFLLECRRVLKPTGVMRLIVPDAEALMKCYPDGLGQFDELSGTCTRRRTPCAKLYELLHAHHASMYDYECLASGLVAAGFTPAASLFRDCPVGDERWRQLAAETLDVLPGVSLFVNATAPPL